MSSNQPKDPATSRKRTKNPKYDPKVWETSDSNKSSKPLASKPYITDVIEQNPTTDHQSPPISVQIPAGNEGSSGLREGQGETESGSKYVYGQVESISNENHKNNSVLCRECAILLM